MASCTISFHPFAQGTVTKRRGGKDVGPLHFIRFVRVTMFEIERRSDVSHDFENCCAPFPKRPRTAMMNSNQPKEYAGMWLPVPARAFHLDARVNVTRSISNIRSTESFGLFAYLPAGSGR